MVGPYRIRVMFSHQVVTCHPEDRGGDWPQLAYGAALRRWATNACLNPLGQRACPPDPAPSMTSNAASAVP